MRYYVYALIDPTNGNRPFYIGKGLAGRLQSHFASISRAQSSSDLGEIIGCDTESLLQDARESLVSSNKKPKAERLLALLNNGFTHGTIARVIARRLDEDSALAIEAYLIRSVYGLDALSNRAEGTHFRRFRPKGADGFLEGFNFKNQSLPQSELGKYYIYMLRDPDTGKVFYVGKGIGGRIWQHFQDAKRETNNPNEKQEEIRRLLSAGHSPESIAGIIGWIEHEPTAFAIEALAVKFVHGLSDLSNIQTGHHHGLFRAKDDWDLRTGFDLPFAVYPGQRQDRTEMLDGMIGEGLDRPLLEVQKHFPDISFDPPKVLDSKDLGIEGDLTLPDGSAGPRLKVFIVRSSIGIELRHRRKAQREWIQKHFKRLNAYPLRRKGDDIFYPTPWLRCNNGQTDDPVEVVRRVRLMLEVVYATRRESLSAEARALLEVPA